MQIAVVRYRLAQEVMELRAREQFGHPFRPFGEHLELMVSCKGHDPKDRHDEHVRDFRVEEVRHRVHEHVAETDATSAVDRDGRATG